jgi:alpha-galactosidase
MITLSEISPKLLRAVLINVFIVGTYHEQERDLTSITMTASGSGLKLTASWGDDTAATVRLRPPDAPAGAVPSQPLVEAITAAHGRDWAGRRYVTTMIGQRLRHRGHHIDRRGPWQTLSVEQSDEVTGLRFVSVLSIHDDHLAVRGTTRVVNAGAQPVTLLAVSSLVFADFGWLDGDRGIETMTLLRGGGDWLAEGRWVERGLRESGLPALVPAGRPMRSRGCIEVCSLSSWSTAYEYPVAALRDTVSGRGWSFQVEHNGGWLWQIGETPAGLYLALTGPTDEQHQWRLELAAGESFETVPACLALEDGHRSAPIDALTAFRRASLRTPRPDGLPVVFNDYMNTVNGDPSAAVLQPLIDAAAGSGAEVFVIDAGWYANGGDWWDSVGEWLPSTSRFPGGIDEVFDHIRSRGMVPGLWLEPEVVGVNSPMAVKLPDAAFLQRDRVRVVENGRYHLDLSSEASVAFLDEVIDRLITDHGVGYFKFDYNIRAGCGSDAHTAAAGHGLLLHNRAFLAWVDALRRRHPTLVLENCASGGMRQDFATVSRFDLQSTSDQEDLHAYAPIAAAAPMLVLPEQAANWAYPQPGMTEQDIIYTLCTGMLGRLYLSGWLDRLDSSQHGIVAQAVRAHKLLREQMPRSRPFWPLGLPGWDDDWVVLGLRDDQDTVFLTIWRRARRAGQLTIALPPAPPGHRWSAPTAVFPAESPLSVTWDHRSNALLVADEAGLHAARVLALRPEPDQ